MGVNLRKICQRCGKAGVETFDCGDGPEDDTHCPRCNDRLIAKSNEAREFAYYHPTGK